MRVRARVLGVGFGVGLCVTAASVMVACGDDENLVRSRPDAGAADASADGSEWVPGRLACGATVPVTYDSPNFAANAAGELELKARFGELDNLMKSAEGTGTAVVTSAAIQAIFTTGTPSLRAVATAAAQAKVDEYITQFGDIASAGGKTWTPEAAEAEGGAPSGGKFENTYIFSATGVDLREGVSKTLLGGALYNHALSLSTGPLTEATIDRLLAVFGATTKLANRTDPDAGVDEKDELVAKYAARRDSKVGSALGPYRKIRGALLVAKAAAVGGEKCRTDLDDALKVYFLEWEKATYLTVIFYLNAAAKSATSNPPKGSAALHGFGEAAGLIQSFRGVPQDRRKITDAQIDRLQQLVGASVPYQLMTRTPERVVSFNTAFQEIGAIYGLTQTDIEEAKKVY